MTWTTFVPREPTVIQRKWYMNVRAYVQDDHGGWGHEAGNVEVPHGNAQTIPIPDGVYSFRIFSVAETSVTVEDDAQTTEELVLRSDPLEQGPVYFVKERVKVLSLIELEKSYPPDDVGDLIVTMKAQSSKVCLELPGKIFMPVVSEVHFVELGTK